MGRRHQSISGRRRLHRIQGQVPRCAPTLCATRAAMAATLLAARSTATTRSYLTAPMPGFVFKDFDMYHTNSCEYEPWSNPTERHMRTLREPMRMVHKRGGAGEETGSTP
eukprot:6184470-Pleurochrysis_carterae.AAC.2